jgi:hypothetical protein
MWRGNHLQDGQHAKRHRKDDDQPDTCHESAPQHDSRLVAKIRVFGKQKYGPVSTIIGRYDFKRHALADPKLAPHHLGTRQKPSSNQHQETLESDKKHCTPDNIQKIFSLSSMDCRALSNPTFAARFPMILRRLIIQ